MFLIQKLFKKLAEKTNDFFLFVFIAVLGDISEERVNAIVNAANELLQYGTGVRIPS